MNTKTSPKVVESKDFSGSARVIGQHSTLAAAMKRAEKNVSGTFIIHEPETELTRERFLVSLPELG